MVSNELLSILCCPETKQNLGLAETALIKKINQRIDSGSLKTRGGKAVTVKIDAGLIRTDRQFLYAVRSDIPVMLIDEAIPLAGLL